MLTDSHAHLTHGGDVCQDSLQQQLARAAQNGVIRIINISTTPVECLQGLALKQQFPWVDNAAATPPHDVEKTGEEDFAFFAEQAEKGHLTAIGETGLDYYYQHSAKQLQQHFLERYLALATQYQLPVIIHCRNAFADFFSILDHHYQGLGVLHCFTGTLTEAKQLIDRGWYLSLSGIVTFKNSLELQEVAKIVPLDQLLIETDSPYLAPHPMRGKTNEPAFLRYTASFIAQLRGISLDALGHATTCNARKLFHS